MLVVLAIIFILAAMLFPVYEAVQAKAEGATCLSNMRNLGVASRIYADDYDGTIVPASIAAGIKQRHDNLVRSQIDAGESSGGLISTREQSREVPL